MRGDKLFVTVLAVLFISLPCLPVSAAEGDRFEGRYYRGRGDVEYLKLLDISRRLFEPDPEFQNLPMLYTPAWNGLVEGPTWGAWWIQNSYGPTYCELPFLQEPYVTFLQNSQDLWFEHMGDGQWKWRDQVVPDGNLCDCASPGWVMPKQGDGRVDIHDWGVEFTAAGVVMQAELLLISRDIEAIRHYLPLLERSADFIESRRDPKNNLFLAGPAGNLLAPSYAGCKNADDTYGKAYLAGLSITYIAALDRLIELEKMAGDAAKVELYSKRRDLARQGLPLLTTDEGYFVKSMDPDGTRHGVFGADRFGYFEAVCNHDAVCFRVVDDAQAAKIYDKIAALPGLRPHGLIITNYPGLDDMYHPGNDWLWGFGTWVNGGHWTTCEARMMMGYYRLGKYEDNRRAMEKILDYARRFRMDNPLVEFGNQVYQPGEPINCCYDTWGAPAAMIRGLFEYLYRADGLEIVPHIPPGITQLEQDFPIRFGQKRLYLATAGQGPVTGVTVNGEKWTDFTPQSIFLPYDKTPDKAVIQISLGGAAVEPFAPTRPAPLASVAETEVTLPPLPHEPLIAANDLPLRIGADSNGESRFPGTIAQARIFDRTLSPDQITALAAAGPGKTSEGLNPLGDWRPGDRRENQVPNAAGNSLPAKVVGELDVIDTDQGKAGQWAGNGYLEVAADPRLNTTDALTLDAWICPDQLPPGGGRILDKCPVGTSNGFTFDTCPGNSLRLILSSGTLSYDAKLPAGKWVHVAATASPDGKMTLFVDGKPVATGEASSQWEAEWASLLTRVAAIRGFLDRMEKAGLGDGYEAAHARLAAEYPAVTAKRLKMIADGKLPKLEEARSQTAADRSYLQAAVRLCEGLEKTLDGYEQSTDPARRRIYRLWKNLPDPPPADSPTTSTSASATADPPAEPTPEHNHRTDWFQKAGYGVFVHYLNDVQNNPGTIQSLGRSTSWDECVREFQVDRFADAMAEAGAGYVIFTMHQRTQYFIAPNATFDRLTGYQPGEACSTRDLVEDLYTALSRKNIPLMLYWTGNGPCVDPKSAAALNWTRPVNKDYLEKWAAITREYGERYGDKVAGWWVDGCYYTHGDLRYDDEKLGILAEALRAGNPNRIIALNPGVEITAYSRHEDYTAGEQNQFHAMPAGRWLDGEQWHILSYLGGDRGENYLGAGWCEPGVRYGKRELAEYIFDVNQAGGVVSIDVLLYRDGGLDRSQLEVLKSLRPLMAAMKVQPPIPPGNLAFRKPARLLSLDGSHELVVNRVGDARYGVDGKSDTSALAAGEWPWTYEIDLLEPRAVRRIKVNFAQRGFATELRLQVSTDKQTWQTVTTADNLDGSPFEAEFAPVQARWVRIEALKPNGPDQQGTQMAISELEVYE